MPQPAGSSGGEGVDPATAGEPVGTGVTASAGAAPGAETAAGRSRPGSGAAACVVAVAGAPPLPWTVVIIGLLAASGMGVTVAVLGLQGEGAAVPLGAVFSGTVAFASGLALWVRGLCGPRRARFRLLLGMALLAWSVGQLINGVAVILGRPAFPTTGDMVSLVAAPLAVAGLLAVPRRSAAAHPGWRLGLDSGLLGIGFALLFWHFMFADLLLPRGVGFDETAALVVVVADVTIVCLGILAFMRDLDRDLLLVLAGAGFFTAGDILTVHSSMQAPGEWPWEGAFLWCLSWPLIVVGLLRYEPEQAGAADRSRTRIDPDARGVAVTTTVSLGLLVLSLGLLMLGDTPDPVAIGLVMLAVTIFGARELFNMRLRSQLLHRLHREATADPLTGLANRRALAGRMNALPRGEPWCLLTVDLDGFKDVNDLLGHSTGDQLLAAVARRLDEAVPDGALVSRIGGDEFAVLLSGDLAWGSAVGERIVTAVRRSAADVEGVTRVEVSASVGVAAVHGVAGAAVSAAVSTIVLPDAPALPPSAPYLPAPVGGRAGTEAINHAIRDAIPLSMPPSQVGPDGPVTAKEAAGAAGPAEQAGAAGRAAAAEPAGAQEPGAAVAAAVAAAGTAVDHGEAPVVDALEALSASGAALRVAKAAGRNRVEVYDAAVARMRRRRLRVEERLRSAVDSGDIKVLYQPIIDLRRGVVTGAEALARWVDPQLGVVDPGEFIPVAEQTGLVVALGERVLDETLRAAVTEGLFDRGLRLSCNVSPVQLRVAGFHRVVQEALTAHGVDRDRLVIEVTEQVVVEEGQAVQTLHRLTDLGITIAIDDFGTGYSALGYLQRLPAEVLKIDRSLTSSLVAEPRSRAITRAVIDMGRTVGLTIVIEGVEDEEVADLVGRMKVRYAQGSYYGAAMTAPELAAMADRLAGATTSDPTPAAE